MSMVKTDMPEAKPASLIYRDHIKRVVDLAIAVHVFVVACIPMGIVAAAIKIDSKGPVLFKQERIGKDKKIYIRLKFRTVGVNKKASCLAA